MVHSTRKTSIIAAALAVTLGTAGFAVATAPGATSAPTTDPSGARELRLAANVTKTGAAVQVGNYSYTPVCSVTGRGATISIKTEIVMRQTGEQVYNLYGPVQSQVNDKGAIGTVTDNFHDRTGASALFTEVGHGQLTRFYYSLDVVGNDGSLQHVYLRLTADGDGRLAAHEARCMADGYVLPAS